MLHMIEYLFGFQARYVEGIGQRSDATTTHGHRTDGDDDDYDDDYDDYL